MQRLTYEEILKNYPNLHVGLTDVEYQNNDGITIESGIVSYTSQNTSYDKLLEMALLSQIDLIYTNPNHSIHVGVIS